MNSEHVNDLFEQRFNNHFVKDHSSHDCYFRVNASATFQEVLADEFPTLIEEALDDKWEKSYHNARSSIQAVFCNVVEQEVLDLLRKNSLGNKSNAHMATFSTDKQPLITCRNILTSSLFMTPIVNFWRRKTNSDIADKESVEPKASKNEQVAAAEKSQDVIDSLLSRSESYSEGPLQSFLSANRSITTRNPFTER